MARPRSKQPIREVPGGTYGDAQASTRLQQQAPLPAPSAPGETALNPPTGSPGAVPTGPTPPGSVPFVPPAGPPDVFGPSTTPPVEPLLPSNQFGILTALYQRFPNEDLRRLIERAAYYASRPRGPQ